MIIEAIMSPVIRLHLLGILLLGISYSLTGSANIKDFRLLVLSEEPSVSEPCCIKGFADVVSENINPYQAMDVLSFISNMERAVEAKADAILLPHSIVMETNNSILKDYLKKLSREKQILFVAPAVGSKSNIFSDWRSLSMDTVKSGVENIKDLRMKRKLSKLSKVLKSVDLSTPEWKRFKLYM